MSKAGIEFAAQTLSMLREARQTLMRGDDQDFRLGQLFREAREAIEDNFTQIKLEKG